MAELLATVVFIHTCLHDVCKFTDAALRDFMLCCEIAKNCVLLGYSYHLLCNNPEEHSFQMQPSLQQLSHNF
jgi:hypothetical protein